MLDKFQPYPLIRLAHAFVWACQLWIKLLYFQLTELHSCHCQFNKVLHSLFQEEMEMEKEEEEDEMISHPEPTELTTMSHETFQLNSEVPIETTTLESLPFIAEEEQFDFGKFESTSEAASHNLSDILFNKARARPQNFKDTTDGLSVPSDMPEISQFDLPEVTPTTIDKPEMMTPPNFDESEGSTESTTEHQVNQTMQTNKVLK